MAKDIEEMRERMKQDPKLSTFNIEIKDNGFRIRDNLGRLGVNTSIDKRLLKMVLDELRPLASHALNEENYDEAAHWLRVIRRLRDYHNPEIEMTDDEVRRQSSVLFTKELMGEILQWFREYGDEIGFGEYFRDTKWIDKEDERPKLGRHVLFAYGDTVFAGYMESCNEPIPNNKKVAPYKWKTPNTAFYDHEISYWMPYPDSPLKGKVSSRSKA